MFSILLTFLIVILSSCQIKARSFTCSFGCILNYVMSYNLEWFSRSVTEAALYFWDIVCMFFNII